MSARSRCAAGAFVLTLLSARTGTAQSALLPLDDIAYTYINALQARGQLRELPVIERPYTVGAVRAAVRSARASLHDAGSQRWFAAIDAATDKYAAGVTAADTGVFTASLAGYGVAQTSGTRDLMQSDRKDALAPGFTVRALLQSGPFTGAMRVLADRRMRVDPEFFGRKDRVLSARTEDAYLSATSRFATLQIGRVGRSWGLPGQLGLMVSNGAYTYDHAFLRLGTDRIHLATVVARLDDERLNFSTDTVAQRYFTAHRLAMSVGGLEAGISESVIYGGVARGFRPNLSNPVSPAFLAQYSDGDKINVAFGADALWRAHNGMMLGGQLYLDDFQIDKCELCGEPPGFALSSLTYRAPDRFERYTSRTVGLGQRNSDFDELRAGVDIGPVLPAPVRVYVAYRRQGAGDYREPYPAASLLSSWPTMFEGVVVKVLRVGASGAMRLGSSVEVSLDAGINHSANDLRVARATKTRPEGRLLIALEPSWARIRTLLY
jgi:hypothetical protein